MPSLLHNGRWQNPYMREYRQGKLRRNSKEFPPNLTRREELKKVNRLDTCKWRLSKLLGRQYDLLFYVQYEPEKWAKEYDLPKYKHTDFPAINYFSTYFNEVGGDIFKVFVFIRFSKNYEQMTPSVVGVLDKASLLNHLQQIMERKRTKEQCFLEMNLAFELSLEEWRALDFSAAGYLQLKSYTYCLPLKWTARKHPDLNDTHLYSLLWRWYASHRLDGKWDKWEIQGVNNGLRRGMFSPIFASIA